MQHESGRLQGHLVAVLTLAAIATISTGATGAEIEVLILGDNQPVSGADVLVSRPDTTTQYVSTSNDDGIAFFQDVPTGKVRITVQASGWRESATQMTVRPPTNRITIDLTSPGDLRVVVNGDGERVSDAYVTITSEESTNDSRRRTGTTNSDGVVLMNGTPPGSYFITVTCEGWEDWSESRTVDSYRTTVTARLQRVTGLLSVTILGHGRPIPNARVRVEGVEERNCGLRETARANNEGTVRLTVPIGRTKLQITAEGWRTWGRVFDVKSTTTRVAQLTSAVSIGNEDRTLPLKPTPPRPRSN